MTTAYNTGFDDGIKGESPIPPYGDNTDEQAQYSKGYKTGFEKWKVNNLLPEWTPAPMWDKQLYEEAQQVKKAAGPYGSAFDRSLVSLMEVADQENLRKIRATWLEEWAKLLKLYGLAKAKGLL